MPFKAVAFTTNREKPFYNFAYIKFNRQDTMLHGAGLAYTGLRCDFMIIFIHWSDKTSSK